MSLEQDMSSKDEEQKKSEETVPTSEEQNEFSFLQETIKDEQPSGKRTFYKIVKIAGLGVLFGIAACIGFFALKPWAETKFQKDPSEVVIPPDVEEEEGQDGEGGEVEDVPVQPELTIENYRELNSALYEVAGQVNRSIVEVTAVRSDDNWQETSYDTKNSVSGIFIEDNGQEVLILTYSRLAKDMESLEVTFADNETYVASIKKKDDNLGIMVVSIAKSSIKQGTWNQIQKATLGNSNVATRGESVIALGNQFGYSGSLGYGVISLNRNTVMKADGFYHIINTDIAAVEKGTGVLANLRGEIIGLIDQSISSTDSMNLTTAYAVSDLKAAIQELSNGKGVPYIGIVGTDVNETISGTEGVPEGIYVSEVNTDSPGMNAGIKSGDIITGFAGEMVTNLQSFHKQLTACEVGQAVKIEGKRMGPEGYVDIKFEVSIGSME